MKDLQIDATALPGKAFDLSFEMPEPDVGIMTFNRCVAVDQWESMGRPDILEKNCHSTCPKSMIVTTKMYNPNMKVDILAIPPRVDAGRRVLQVAVQHARRERPGVRLGPGELHTEALGPLLLPVERRLALFRGVRHVEPAAADQHRVAERDELALHAYGQINVGDCPLDIETPFVDECPVQRSDAAHVEREAATRSRRGRRGHVSLQPAVGT